jgi:hypothetical protein
MGQRDAWIFTAIYALMNAGFIGIPGWSDWRDRRIGAQAHRQLKRLLESAVEVTVQRVETEKVVEILGDEVDLYLFELEGRRYFVGDKWTLHSPRQGRGAKWPNSCFELIRIPGSIEEFGPFCYGRKIEPFESLDFRDVDLDK